MKNLFRFKAIETVYNGYRMRSRLEARHAVFFDTLGIKYEYEKEGYALPNGAWYLPDFWLPDHDCFIEIKGEVPTEDELDKARLLAICTRKTVCIFHGEITLPDPFSLERLNSYLFRPAHLWTYLKSEGLGGPSTHNIDAPVYLLMLLQELKDCYLDLFVHSFDEVVIAPERVPYGIDSIDDLFEKQQKQQKILSTTRNLLEEKEEEIAYYLTPEDGWEIEFLPQSRGLEDDCLWGECDTCGTFRPTIPSPTQHFCDETAQGHLTFETPRLIAAYTAARQARFEHKKSRSEEVAS